MNRPDKMRRRVHRSIAAVVVLCGLLALTTYALVASLVSVEGHLFETAQVKIELNGGKVIFDAGDMNIEPGYSIRRNFTVENQGTADVYYRLYLENTAGPLLGVLDFALYDGDTLLFAGTAGHPYAGKSLRRCGAARSRGNTDADRCGQNARGGGQRLSKRRNDL